MAIKGIIAGLGNPGEQYAATRHNYGFLALDTLLEHCTSKGRLENLSGPKNNWQLWRGTLPDGDQWLFIKPLNYMNRSGLAIQPVCAFYKISPEKLVVLHDELDLPLGRVKWKRGGGNAGHNGLKSIQECFGTPGFARIRLGIGRPDGYDPASYVLGRFSPDEKTLLSAVTEAVLQGLLLYMEKGERFAEQYLNGFALPEKPLP